MRPGLEYSYEEVRKGSKDFPGVTLYTCVLSAFQSSQKHSFLIIPSQVNYMYGTSALSSFKGLIKPTCILQTATTEHSGAGPERSPCRGGGRASSRVMTQAQCQQDHSPGGSTGGTPSFIYAIRNWNVLRCFREWSILGGTLSQSSLTWVLSALLCTLLRIQDLSWGRGAGSTPRLRGALGSQLLLFPIQRFSQPQMLPTCPHPTLSTQIYTFVFLDSHL